MKLWEGLTSTAAGEMSTGGGGFLGYFHCGLCGGATGLRGLVLAALRLGCWLLLLIFSEAQNHQARPATKKARATVRSSAMRLKWYST